MSAATGRREIEQRLKTTAGQVGIAGSQLRTIPIPVPPLAEQSARIASWERGLQAMAHLRTELQTSIRRADAARRSILGAAFSGKLVPQDPADEPASVLLARIRAERDTLPKARRAREAAT